jgi:hypothetical protein
MTPKVTGYVVLRIIVIKFLPCVLLFILEVKLIRNLNKASLVRKHTNTINQRKDVPMRLSAQTAWIVKLIYFKTDNSSNSVFVEGKFLKLMQCLYCLFRLD